MLCCPYALGLSAPLLKGILKNTGLGQQSGNLGGLNSQLRSTGGLPDPPCGLTVAVTRIILAGQCSVLSLTRWLFWGYFPATSPAPVSVYEPWDYSHVKMCPCCAWFICYLKKQ